MAGEGNPAVLDDITAAQQYVLDLQVLFYSLKTVAANGQKAAPSTEAEAATADSKPARNGVSKQSGADGDLDTTALQQHVELRVQLEQERAERARLQEQLDAATDLLRKSYGQIVDDYLFATEQLHMRTRQLEELMARQAAGGAAGQPGEAQPVREPGGGSAHRVAGGQVPPQEASAAWPRQAAGPVAAAHGSLEASARAAEAAESMVQGAASSAGEHATSSSNQEGPWGSSSASGQSPEAAPARGGSIGGGCEEVDAGPVVREAAAEPGSYGAEVPAHQHQQSEWLEGAHLHAHRSAPQPRTHLPAQQHPQEGGSGRDDLQLPAPRRRSEVTVWAVASPPASSPIREVSDSYAVGNSSAGPAAATTTFVAAAAAPPTAVSPYAGAYPSPGLSSLFAGADSDASTPPPNYPPSVAASTCSPFSMPASCARVFGARAGGLAATAAAVHAAAAVPGASPAGLGHGGARSERPSAYGGSDALPVRLFHSAEDESAWGASEPSVAPAVAVASTPLPRQPSTAGPAATGCGAGPSGATAAAAAAGGGGGGGASTSRGHAHGGEVTAAVGRTQAPQSHTGHQHPQDADAENQAGARSPVDDKREGPAGKRLRRSFSSPVEDPASLWRHLATAGGGSSSAGGAQEPVAAATTPGRASSAAPLRPGPPPGEPSQTQNSRKGTHGPLLGAVEKEAAARGPYDGSSELRSRRGPSLQGERATAAPHLHEARDARVASSSHKAPTARGGNSSSPGPASQQRHGAPAAVPIGGSAHPLRTGHSPAARSRSHSKDSSAADSGTGRGRANGNDARRKAAHRKTAAGAAKGSGSRGGAATGGSGKAGTGMPAPAGSSGSGASGLSYSSSLDGLASMVRGLRQQLEGLQRDFRRGEPGEEEEDGHEEAYTYAANHGHGKEEEQEDEEGPEDQEGAAGSGRRWAAGLFTPDSSAARGGAFEYRSGVAEESDSSRPGRHRHEKDAGLAASSSASNSSSNSRPAHPGGSSPYSPYARTYYDTASSSAGASPAPASATRHSTLPHGIDISPVAAYLREQRQHEHTASSAGGGAGGARREPAGHFAPSTAPRTFSAKAGTGSAASAAAHAGTAPLRSPLQQHEPAVNRFRNTEAVVSQPGRPGPPEAHHTLYGDRTLPPDQTGPRKASTATAATAAAAVAAGCKVPVASFQPDNHGPAGVGTGAAAGRRGCGAAPGEPLFPPSLSSVPLSYGLGGSRADQSYVAAAAAADDVGGTSAAKLQGLRSEAMFARIKQQLDELQSSFTHSSNGAAGGAALGSGHSHVGAGLGLGMGVGVGAEAPAAGLRRNGTGGNGARAGGLR